MTFHKIGSAMVGSGLIGQPARAVGNGRERFGDIEGIRLEHGAWPEVIIAGQRTSLAEWEVYVDVPEKRDGPEQNSPNAESPREPDTEPRNPDALAAEALTDLLINRQAREYPDPNRSLAWWPDGPGLVVEYTDLDNGARTVYLQPEEAVRFLLTVARAYRP